MKDEEEKHSNGEEKDDNDEKIINYVEFYDDREEVENEEEKDSNAEEKDDEEEKIIEYVELYPDGEGTGGQSKEEKGKYIEVYNKDTELIEKQYCSQLKSPHLYEQCSS